MKIRELSRISGISPATISKMLKDSNSVKESTRNKINNILKNKGMDKYFNINFIRKIILIIPDLSNTFYLDLFNGIVSVVQEQNTPFELYLTNESIDAEVKIFSRIKEDKGMGVIWVPASAKRDKLPYSNANIISLVDRNLEFEDILIKNLSNNFSAAKKAADLLIEGGAKNPIIITGSLNLSNAQERKEGFLESIRNHNLDSNINRVYYGDFNNSESGYEIVKKLVKDNIKFDSILAANQILAIGILKALKELKLSIPEDVSIIIFDKLVNLYHLSYENSNISEVVFPAFDIGVNAASVLLEQKTFNAPKQIYNYSAQFHLRGSEKKQ